jgi:hypothetical protein
VRGCTPPGRSGQDDCSAGSDFVSSMIGNTQPVVDPHHPIDPIFPCVPVNLHNRSKRNARQHLAGLWLWVGAEPQYRPHSPRLEKPNQPPDRQSLRHCYSLPGPACANRWPGRFFLKIIKAGAVRTWVRTRAHLSGTPPPIFAKLCYTVDRGERKSMGTWGTSMRRCMQTIAMLRSSGVTGWRRTGRAIHATIAEMTSPCTSVSRMSRPPKR